MKRKQIEKEIAELSKYKSPITGRPGTVTCPVCKSRVSSKRIVNHYNKNHVNEISRADKSLLRREVHNNKRRTSSVDDFENRSEDVFDRGKVLQGGAIGLGKNRRN